MENWSFTFTGKSGNHVHNQHNEGFAEWVGRQPTPPWWPSSQSQPAEGLVGEDIDAGLEQTDTDKSGVAAFLHPREDLVSAEVTDSVEKLFIRKVIFRHNSILIV